VIKIIRRFPFERFIEGQSIVRGSLLWMRSAGPRKKFLYAAIAWCLGGQKGIKAVQEIRFEHELAVLGARPVPKYAGCIEVEHKLGTHTQRRSRIVMRDFPGGVQRDCVPGVAYTVLKLKWDRKVFRDFDINKVRAKVQGNGSQITR